MSATLRAIDLALLNSITKYPSIATHHALDPSNGRLTAVATQFPRQVIGTEKVDGTNARIIAMPDGGYVIGSREELLYGRGDLIRNKALGIVDALHGLAETIAERPRAGAEVYFLEVFGGKVTGASKQYTTDQSVSHRLFDAIRFGDLAPLLTRPASDIAAWREGGGQPFIDEAALQALASELSITLTPRLFTLDGAALPQDIAGMAAFLAEQLPKRANRKVSCCAPPTARSFPRRASRNMRAPCVQSPEGVSGELRA